MGQLTAVNTVSTKQCRWCSVLILVLFAVLNCYRFEIPKDLKSVTKAYMYGVLCQKKLELSRAHTPHTPSICSLLYRDRPVMLTISTKPVVRMAIFMVTTTTDRQTDKPIALPLRMHAQ